jgi:hypothetical protein
VTRRAGVEKRNIYSPFRESKHNFSAIQSTPHQGSQQFMKSTPYGSGVPIVSATDTEKHFEEMSEIFCL